MIDCKSENFRTYLAILTRSAEKNNGWGISQHMLRFVVTEGSNFVSL